MPARGEGGPGETDEGRATGGGQKGAAGAHCEERETETIDRGRAGHSLSPAAAVGFPIELEFATRKHPANGDACGFGIVFSVAATKAAVERA